MVSFYGVNVTNPLLLGTAQYPSPAVLAAAIRASGVEVVTASLRREAGGGQRRLKFLGINQGLTGKGFAQYGRLLLGKRSGNNRPSGAGSV